MGGRGGGLRLTFLLLCAAILATLLIAAPLWFLATRDRTLYNIFFVLVLASSLFLFLFRRRRLPRRGGRSSTGHPPPSGPPSP